MTRVLVSLTARQLLGRRRTLFMALVVAVPVGIALIYRYGAEPGPGVDPAQVSVDLVGSLILTLLLPLVALVLGTASLGAEIEDGTAVFLLTKPVPRWRIVAVKTGVAATATLALVVPSTFATAWIVTGNADALALGLCLSAAVASVLYSAVFVALAAVTSRALLFGLLYVFVWEVFATNLFDSLRWLSIREYAVAWSQLAVTISGNDIVDPGMATVAAAVGSAVVLGLAAGGGTYALSRFEIRDSP